MAQMHRHLCIQPKRHRVDALLTCATPSFCDKPSAAVASHSTDAHSHTGRDALPGSHAAASADSAPRQTNEKANFAQRETGRPHSSEGGLSPASTSAGGPASDPREIPKPLGSHAREQASSGPELSNDVSRNQTSTASSNEHTEEDRGGRRSSSPVKALAEGGAATSGGKERAKTRPAALKFLAVKDGRCGWLLGSASMNREFYVALDDPKTTLTKAMEDGSRFEYMHFANIFV